MQWDGVVGGWEGGRVGVMRMVCRVIISENLLSLHGHATIRC